MIMRLWMKKFKLSRALDSNSPMPGNLRDPEVQNFSKAIQELDQQFRNARPVGDVPESLHHSIMCKVRNSGRPEQRAPMLLVRWLAGATVAALLVAAVLFNWSRPQPDAQTLAAASAALSETHQMAQNAPAAVLSPLEREMEMLNRDLRNAMAFLAASVP